MEQAVNRAWRHRPHLPSAVSWLLTGWIAWLQFYCEQFKLNAAEGSIGGVFQPLANWFGPPGHEPLFRRGVALREFAAATLVINQPTRWFGALMTMGLMGGTVFLHALGPIEVDPYNDGAILTKKACFIFVVALSLLVLHRDEALVSGLRSPGRA